MGSTRAIPLRSAGPVAVRRFVDARAHSSASASCTRFDPERGSHLRYRPVDASTADSLVSRRADSAAALLRWRRRREGRLGGGRLCRGLGSWLGRRLRGRLRRWLRGRLRRRLRLHGRGVLGHRRGLRCGLRRRGHRRSVIRVHARGDVGLHFRGRSATRKRDGLGLLGARPLKRVRECDAAADQRSSPEESADDQSQVGTAPGPGDRRRRVIHGRRNCRRRSRRKVRFCDCHRSRRRHDGRIENRRLARLGLSRRIPRRIGNWLAPTWTYRGGIHVRHGGRDLVRRRSHFRHFPGGIGFRRIDHRGSLCRTRPVTHALQGVAKSRLVRQSQHDLPQLQRLSETWNEIRIHRKRDALRDDPWKSGSSEFFL